MNEVVKKQEVMPITADDMLADSGAGGNVTLQDVGIPFLTILQSNSPQAIEDHAKFIPGARAGMLYLSVIDKIFDGREKGLTCVPCYYERSIVEWKLRSDGGGLIDSYGPDDPITNNAFMKEVEGKQLMMLPNGHMLQETAYWYLLLGINDAWRQVVMTMKSTHLKASRKWNNEITSTFIPGIQPSRLAPRWLYKYNLKTAKENKDQYVFSVPLISQIDMVDKDTYVMAKEYSGYAAKGLLRRKVQQAEAMAEGSAVNDSSVI